MQVCFVYEYFMLLFSQRYLHCIRLFFLLKDWKLNISIEFWPVSIIIFTTAHNITLLYIQYTVMKLYFHMNNINCAMHKHSIQQLCIEQWKYFACIVRFTGSTQEKNEKKNNMKNEVSERNICYVMITHHIHNPFYSILFFFF